MSNFRIESEQYYIQTWTLGQLLKIILHQNLDKEVMRIYKQLNRSRNC